MCSVRCRWWKVGFSLPQDQRCGSCSWIGAFADFPDDRFIAKEISRLEMDALTKFAPAYFEYTRKAFQGHVSYLGLI